MNPYHDEQGRFTSGVGGTASEGSTVRVPHRGKMVTGKVVRYERKPRDGATPFYVVDVGEYESPKVPEHKVEIPTPLLATPNIGGGFRYKKHRGKG